MKNTFFLVVGLVLIFGSIFLFFERTLMKEGKVKVLKINDVNIEVEVADTPETREKGLSGREKLPEGTGMLFIFDRPNQYGFWMKDMRFAIDIVWIDEKYHVVGIEREVLPSTFPQTFYPNQPIKYVLELPAGSSDRYNIDINTVVQYEQ